MEEHGSGVPKWGGGWRRWRREESGGGRRWRLLHQFPIDGLLFHAKMKWEQGVVVSDASELLFEDIKKLNAQQRPDVPACFIYAPHQPSSDVHEKTHRHILPPNSRPLESEWHIHVHSVAHKLGVDWLCVCECMLVLLHVFTYVYSIFDFR